MPGQDEDQAELRVIRLRQVAREVANEDRAAMWDRVNINIRTDVGVEKLENILKAFERLGLDVQTEEGRKKTRKTIEWATRSAERSETVSKRLLIWITAGLTMIGTIAGIVNQYLTWRSK